MLNRAQLFLPGSARRVRVRLRFPQGTATVRLLVDGRVATGAIVAGAGWHQAEVTIPASPRRFVPLRLEATTVLADGGGVEAGGQVVGRLQVAMPEVLE